MALPDGRLVKVTHLNDYVMAHAKTQAQWTAWNKRQAEKEFRIDQDSYRFFQLNEHVSQLRDRAQKAIKAKKYQAAEALLQQALEFKWSHQPDVDEKVEKDLLSLYHRTREVSAGLALLDKIQNQYPNPKRPQPQWIEFALQFEKSKHYRLAEKIHRETITRFPHHPAAYKRLVLTLERSSQYEEALEVCRLAIERNIKDNTKTGYQGRINRIENRINKTTMTKP